MPNFIPPSLYTPAGAPPESGGVSEQTALAIAAGLLVAAFFFL